MANEEKIPQVVLAGRPNVGKSTLFNRLLRKRRAITDPTPGVTRDPVAAEARILGVPVRLIDTGGFKLEKDAKTGEDEGAIEDEVRQKTLDTVKKADLIVLLLAAGEITPEDEEFIEILRPCRERLILAVNKTEGGRREAEAWNLLALGFEEIFMISAEHGDNIADLEAAIVKRLGFSADGDAEEAALHADDGGGNLSAGGAFAAEKPPIRIALLGKPNTGKSTLSNLLTSSEASIVSPVPGTTRDVVEGTFRYKNQDFLVLDTAGIRRKTKVAGNVEYYSVNRAIKSIDEADIVFLMIDAQEGLTDQDKKIAALAHDKGRGIILVLNKWDTMPDIKNAFQASKDKIHFFFGQMEYAPIAALSAKDGKGVEELLDTARKVYRQLTTRVETAALNSAMEKWLEEYPPPVGPQTRFKVRYAVQNQANPVEFIFFVSRLHAVGEPYVAYLRNRIRRDLGFSLIPVKIELRASAASPRRKLTGSSVSIGKKRRGR